MDRTPQYEWTIENIQNTISKYREDNKLRTCTLKFQGFNAEEWNSPGECSSFEALTFKTELSYRLPKGISSKRCWVRECPSQHSEPFGEAEVYKMKNETQEMLVILDAVSSLFTNALFSAAVRLPNQTVAEKVGTLSTSDV